MWFQSSLDISPNNLVEGFLLMHVLFGLFFPRTSPVNYVNNKNHVGDIPKTYPTLYLNENFGKGRENIKNFFRSCLFIYFGHCDALLIFIYQKLSCK